MALPSSHHHPAEPEEFSLFLRLSERPGVLLEGCISILGTERASGGYTIYRVVFKVATQTPEGVPVIQECEIWKRFSDFQQLWRQLEFLHFQSQSLVPLPSLVKAKYFERFKESVIEDRRKSAEVLLLFATRCHHLANSTALQQFLAGATVVRILPGAPSLEMMSSTYGAPPSYVTSTTNNQSPTIPQTPTDVTVAQDEPPTTTDLISLANEEDEEDATPQANSEDTKLSESPRHSQPETNAGPSLHSDETGRQPPAIDDNHSAGLEGLTWGGDSAGLLAVPPQGDGGLKSNSGSSNTSLEEADSRTNVTPSCSESVEVTEWNVTHSLRLREEELPADFTSTLENIGEKDEEEEEEEEEKEEKEEEEKEKEEEEKEEKEEEREKKSAQVSSGATRATTSEQTQEKLLEDSLDRLTFDTTFPNEQPSSSSAAITNTAAPSGGMDWWAEAFAETQNITEDFDALVQKMEEGGTTFAVSNSPAATSKQVSADLETACSSQHARHEEQSVGVQGEEERGAKVIDLSPSSLHSPTLKAAKSDSSIASPEESSAKSLGQQPHSHSRSEQSLREAAGDSNRGDGGWGLRRLSGQKNPSATSSTESLNGRRKSGSRKSSRSPSPGQQYTSPSLRNQKAYMVQAGRLITQALGYEGTGDYEEAFDLYKAGVDVLLNGVQTESSKRRRDVVRQKIAEYLQHAEELYQTYLLHKEGGGGGGELAATGPQATPVEAPTPASKPHHLPDFKVIGTIGKVILVESKHNGQTYVFKVLYKCPAAGSGSVRGRQQRTRNLSPTQCPHMVQLLHHYETSNHRIFLLLEHVKGGRLVDFVQTKREQWQRLREAVENPQPSNLLVTRLASMDTKSQTVHEQSTIPTNVAGRVGLPASESPLLPESPGEESADQEMERMLGELTSIVPPSDVPLTGSLASEGTDSEATDSIDRLTLMRKRLEEMMGESDGSQSQVEGGDREQPIAGVEPSMQESLDPEGVVDGGSGSISSGTAINIQPPTPTVTSQGALGTLQNSEAHRTLQQTDPLTAGRTVEESLSSVRRTEPAAHGPDAAVSVPGDHSPLKAVPSGGGSSRGSRRSSGQSSPYFSPGSLRNSPDITSKVDDWVRRLEDSATQWTAQIVVALEHLHAHSIICRDLYPGNILLSDSGQAKLTYFGNWELVEHIEKHELADNFYVAPELEGLVEPTFAADWWSLGAILFEILTGQTLISCHPGGLHSHLPLRIPTLLSPEAQSLLRQLLQVNPNERLGSGLAGVEEIKAHPFFASIDWSTV